MKIHIDKVVSFQYQNGRLTIELSDSNTDVVVENLEIPGIRSGDFPINLGGIIKREHLSSVRAALNNNWGEIDEDHIDQAMDDMEERLFGPIEE